MERFLLCASVLCLLGVPAGTALLLTPDEPTAVVDWTASERKMMTSLSLSSLGQLAPDPTNRVADRPEAADLGHRLFFDRRLSVDGTVSCAACHLPDRHFQDDIALGRGIGTTPRRTMPIAGTAHSPWMFWDGRKDSQWSQALGPLESPVEHGGSRLQYAHVIAAHYRSEYESLFGPLPDLSGLPAAGGPMDDVSARDAWYRIAPSDREAVTTVFANIGKAIAAYERTLMPGASRFDRYVDALDDGRTPRGDELLTDREKAGLRLFMGKAQCVNCHNGPLLTDNDFHNTGVPVAAGLPTDAGRADGAPLVLEDEFNCLGRFSDASPGDCSELRYMLRDSPVLERAFKTPSLRSAGDRAPYMHAGQIPDLASVIRHYSRAPKAPDGRSELSRLRLTDGEIDALVAFVHSLTAPVVAPPGYLLDPFEHSGPSGPVPTRDESEGKEQ